MKRSMVNVLKFHSLDIIFINVSYPYLLSSYFFLIYMYVNLFKIELYNKLGPIALSLTCDLPNYACHYMIIRGHPFMTSTRRGRGQAQVDACGRGVQPPCGRPHRKLKLE